MMRVSSKLRQSAGSSSLTCEIPLVFCIEPIFLQVVAAQILQVIAVASASLASEQCEVKMFPT